MPRRRGLAVLEERNRVARELHDAVSQTLFSMMYEAHAAAETPNGDAATKTALARLEQHAAAALGEMRGLVYALRPKSLERDGLAAALIDHAESLKRAHGVPLEIRIEGIPRLPLDHEMALLRIAQEALQNTIKHAGGAAVEVVLRHSRPGTELVVADHGPGFDMQGLSPTTRTMGLSTMRERAAAIRAELTVKTAPGKGTRVDVFLPTPASRR
jgi:signal transduction histidine kinase